MMSDDRSVIVGITCTSVETKVFVSRSVSVLDEDHTLLSVNRSCNGAVIDTMTILVRTSELKAMIESL